MIKIFTTLSAILMGMLAQSQNTPVSAFENIEVVGKVKLVITQSDKATLGIDAPLNAQANIITKIKGKTLYINPRHEDSPVYTIHITAKTLSSLKASDAEVHIANVLATPHLSVSLTGKATLSGNVKTQEIFTLQMNNATIFNCNIQTPQLSANVYDSAKMCLTGSAAKSTVSASRNSLVAARNFQSAQMLVDARDSAQVQIHAATSLEIKVAEQARVVYTGLPASIRMNENAIAIGELKNAAEAMAGK